MAARQVSMGDDDGTTLGLNAADPISFFNATPVVQPSGAGQAALNRALGTGVITTYTTSQSPTSILTITSTEKSLTVQTGTGATMVPAAADFFYVNKPTSQAGLGVGNVRYVSAGVVGVTFSNFTGATITPTASELYKVVQLRNAGVLVLPTLTPTAVPANTIAEQLFTMTGVRAGELLQISKPTAQAGLDIAGCRVAANNQIGITFSNVTAATITPTAAEVYSAISLAGLDARDNIINYGFNVGTVGAVGAGVVITGGSTALLGILATDILLGVTKPTAQAAATNAAIPSSANSVLTADTLTLYFFGVGTGYTPTASEVYGIETVRAAPAAPLKLYSQSLAPTSVAANTCAEQTFTVTGLISGTPVWVNKPSATGQLGIMGVRVSAADTLAINYANVSAAAIVPPTETYIIGNFQVPAPGAGNSVYQGLAAGAGATGNLVSAIRTALVALGLIQGS